MCVLLVINFYCSDVYKYINFHNVKTNILNVYVELSMIDFIQIEININTILEVSCEQSGKGEERTVLYRMFGGRTCCRCMGFDSRGSPCA